MSLFEPTFEQKMLGAFGSKALGSLAGLQQMTLGQNLLNQQIGFQQNTWKHEIDRREVEIKSKQDRELLNKVYLQGREEGMRLGEKQPSSENRAKYWQAECEHQRSLNLKLQDAPPKVVYRIPFAGWGEVFSHWSIPLTGLVLAWVYVYWELVRELIS
jgi:hypothetical protein